MATSKGEPPVSDELWASPIAAAGGGASQLTEAKRAGQPRHRVGPSEIGENGMGVKHTNSRSNTSIWRRKKIASYGAAHALTWANKEK